jgi:FkbM family methyltransferase
MLSVIKQASISLGVYKPARALHRILNPSQRRNFREHRALLSQFINPGDLVFDIGANIGIRTEIMLSLGARVIAFEPQPICAREVRARGNNRLIVVEKAVGATIGTAILHLKRNSVQATLLQDWQGGPDAGTLTVPLTTLDAEMKQLGKPLFCKIDVEGFEAEVMGGLTTPISSLSFEYHCDEHGVAKVRDIFSRLSEIGHYDVNLIGQEDNKWLLPSWISANDFISTFPACASPYYWGDIFVRLTTGSRP